MYSFASLFLCLCLLIRASHSQFSNGNGTSSSIQVHWISDTPTSITGTTFGVPWPEGKHFFNQTTFSLSGAGSNGVPLQTWVTGYWRDGSIKWTGHAIPASDSSSAQYVVSATPSSFLKYRRQPTQRRQTEGGISVKDSASDITVNTGKIEVTFPKEGNAVVSSIKAAGKTVGRNGKLVLHSQSAVADDVASRAGTDVQHHNFESAVESVTVSKEATVRALVTVRGKFKSISGGHDDWLPFVLRFYLYSGSDSIRLIHSIVFDGVKDKDFISGLGIRFAVPLGDEKLYDRHVRLAGVEGGFLTEAVQGITGLRRDPGEEVRKAQIQGLKTPDISTWDERVSSRMQWIPVWNDFSLQQLTPDGFHLKKRTKPGQGWLDVSSGGRSGGLVYLGGATNGGIGLGLRDFWKQFPTGLEISNAGSDEEDGQVTLWLYNPDADPLDLRSYHDGMGQDTYEKQLDALEITYEDFEPGFDSPTGIAKTSEVYIFAFDKTPSSEVLSARGESMNSPPVLYPEPSYVQETKALGSYWSVPDTSNAKAAAIESNLNFLVDFYQGQIEHHQWYGFLHYGDFMHSYDTDRHTWKYDIGGYAWDNSELSPDLFFWQQFIRTGRPDLYRFAEALTRHTGEVDVYHIGAWKGLGTRHGVQHWVDSAKQVRIAQPQYRKYFYYVSGGDERVGELLDEALNTDKTYGTVDAGRKVRTDGWLPKPGQPTSVALGTDYSALAAGWLIAWERRSDRWEEARYKLTRTMAGIANMTNGFVTGSGLYDIEIGELGPPPSDPENKGLVSVGNLGAVFGQVEVLSEIIEYVGDDLPDGFVDAWLDYCFYHGAGAAAQQARYGSRFSSRNLIQGHSRLAAYFAKQRDNSTVAERAWNEFYNGDGFKADEVWATVEIKGPNVLAPIEEASFVSTNAAAQYGLAAIQNLALIPEYL
ncbi:hypothetical protein CSOJ01_12424 [Colletotrichum sojae]|uniref:Tat pathway signal sequence n=1 Tax=Colletotrichum sojae TaxID=2175907 RepID=A0A8H6IVN7_9PEZI|nr:hypothetical protein CSOJ01_12424 [Colletotrichum sojae]